MYVQNKGIKIRLQAIKTSMYSVLDTYISTILILVSALQDLISWNVVVYYFYEDMKIASKQS